MARVIQITHDDTEYSIGFDRRIFATMEDNGVRLDEIMNTPIRALTVLFAYGLRKYHPTLQVGKIDDILTTFLEEYDAGDFLAFVGEEYNSFFGMPLEDSNKKKKELKITSR